MNTNKNMNIGIENPGPSLAISSIEEFESEIGRALPEQYRRFLEKYNGGQPWPHCIDITTFPESPTDIQVFFGLGRDVEASDLRWIVKTYDGLITNEVLPIACDSGGNLFCLVLRGNAHGSIVYFDRSRSDMPPYEVAGDFSQFLRAIRQL
ncbi:MAG TPA: SMI1/KNR4 family protein [Pirellulales bacterium]|jgi:cell wall assembly regulator SMI1|nr:SMI1/KNR4 family protein [Pirellulales bacterium]